MRLIGLSTSAGADRDVFLAPLPELELLGFELFQDLAADALHVFGVGLEAGGGDEQRHALAQFIFGDRFVIDGGGDAVAVDIVGFGGISAGL